MESMPASSLVVSLCKALNGTHHFHVVDRWPRHLGNSNSQASEDIAIQFAFSWRINMANKKKVSDFSHVENTACH